MKRRYGWRPDFPDHRDHVFSSPRVDLPARVDLREGFPLPYDQGQTNSCTGNAVAGAIHFDLIREKRPNPETPSRLFIYYNGRRLSPEGAYSDNGATIRDVVKGVVKWGYCEESLWPFDLERVNDTPLPPAYDDAKKSRIRQYLSVPHNPTSVRKALADGFPVVCGIGCYESIESKECERTGDVAMPDPDEPVRGGHAILLVGYDEQQGRYRFRNSWGAEWGNRGYGTLPYALVNDKRMAADFWAIKFA